MVNVTIAYIRIRHGTEQKEGRAERDTRLVLQVALLSRNVKIQVDPPLGFCKFARQRLDVPSGIVVFFRVYPVYL